MPVRYFMIQGNLSCKRDKITAFRDRMNCTTVTGLCKTLDPNEAKIDGKKY